MLIRTARLIIRPLERADVDAIRLWRPHTDPLLARYNIPIETEQERDAWFALRTGDPTRREFAILTASGQFIGRIGLREMDDRGCAQLGIALGADFLNQGYGTEALTGFLDWYFGEGGFARLVLDVATMNPRAIHVYEKLGFQCLMERAEPADENTVAFLNDPRSEPVRHLFRYENDQIFVLFHEMELTREIWQANFKSQISNVK
jgi:RimJ/RimL family protein N-acetyltransferase